MNIQAYKAKHRLNFIFYVFKSHLRLLRQLISSFKLLLKYHSSCYLSITFKESMMDTKAKPEHIECE